MPDKKTILTYEGLKELEKQLDYLKGKKRLEIAEKIKKAISFGDISENSEYDEAKNEQAALEAKIAVLENSLRNAEVIDDESLQTDEVRIGCKVRILDMDFNEEEEYQIVGSMEADPSKQRISDESPVGSALLGKKVKEVIEVEAPLGSLKFKILEISK
ncbi:MAG TPA: transcription elongation factor GreA [Clostridia bacterium]|jgi:transcription elongation factor GreA|nr:transcription elongation factor GreA [Clostridia bacterium]